MREKVIQLSLSDIAHRRLSLISLMLDSVLCNDLDGEHVIPLWKSADAVRLHFRSSNSSPSSKEPSVGSWRSWLCGQITSQFGCIGNDDDNCHGHGCLFSKQVCALHFDHPHSRRGDAPCISKLELVECMHETASSNIKQYDTQIYWELAIHMNTTTLDHV